MTPTKNIIVAATLCAILSFAPLGAAQAADGAQTMKPLQGISFHAGSKHAAGYFLSDNSACKLVLTLADEANFAPTRFEVTIEAGRSTRYQLAEGMSLEFGCQAGGQAMDVKSLETTAGN